MNLSPDIGHTLLWFWLKIFVFFVVSGIYGLFFLGLIKFFMKAWEKNNCLKMWLCLSTAFFAVIVLLESLFRGIKQ